MGCCQSAPAPPAESSPEEKALSTRENSLGYGNNLAKDLIDEVLRLADDGKFTQNDFNSLATKFHLDMKDLDSLDTPINEFYRHLKEKGAAFSVTRLGALVILLARGTPQEKAQLLFNIMTLKRAAEEAPATMLSEERVVEMLEVLYNICCLWLPQLSATETISEAGTLPREKVDALVQGYEAKKEAALSSLKAAILNGHQAVSQTDFVVTLAGPKLRGLTTSFDFRKSVLTQ